MDKSEFLENLQKEHAAWETQLRRVETDQMTQPGVVGDWSVKDLVAHVTWSEREMVGVLEAMTLVGSELWTLSNDERNAITYEQDRHRPLAEVLSEERAIYQRLLELVEGLSEQDLNDPHSFKDMPEDWIPWMVLRGNTYKHYHEHSQNLRAWLDSKL
jgi:Mycothiol maleylpyruvate isomerase N-terminal domain